MDNPQSSNQKINTKSNTFESLSREELVKKCKGLLLIAQKAKQIKDDIHEENKNLKEQLQNYEIQKQADKKCLAAMQELVSSSAQEKQTETVNQQEFQKHQVNVEKYEEIVIENDSLKSQIKRLLAENEEYLKTIETFGPKSNGADQLSAAEQEITSLRDEIKLLKSKNSKSEDNLKQFKSKLFEFSTKLKHFKSNHAILLEIINDYGKTVPKWQTEIAKVSANICDKVLFYEKQNKELQNRIITLEQQNQSGESDELKVKVNPLENLNETFSNKLNMISDCLAKIETFEEYERPCIVGYNRDRSIIKHFINKLNELFEYDFKGGEVFEDDTIISEEIETRILNHFNEFCSNILIKFSELHSCTANKETLISQINEYETRLQAHKECYKELSVELEQVKLDNTKIVTELNELHTALISNETNYIKLGNVDVINEIKEQVIKKLNLIKTLNITLDEMEISRSQGGVSDELKIKVKSLENLKETFSNKLILISDCLAKIEAFEEYDRTCAIRSNREHSIIKYFVNKLNELFEYDFKGGEVFRDDTVISEEIETRILNHFNEFCSNVLIKFGEFNSCMANEATFKHKINEYETELRALKVSFDELVVELGQVKLDNTNMSDELNELHTALIGDQTNYTKLGNVNTINEIKEQVIGKLNLIKSLNITLDEMQISIKSITSNLDVSKSENQDLLREMKEINQILKERGGIISMQQSKILDLEKRYENLEQEFETQNESLLVKQKDLEKLENLVREKDIDIQKYKMMCESAQSLKDKFASDKMETLSTSTISKAEGQLQLREVDDSFEEKYNKLRVLAIKLKHKITEQNGVLLNLESENKNLTEKLTSNYNAGGNNPSTKEAEEHLRKITIDLENKEKQLNNSLEVEKSLRAELEKSKLMAKKSNVLSLEIEAYEKSLNDLNQKQELNKIQIVELEETIRNLNLKIQSLKEQLKLVEENLESEKQFSIDLKHKNDFQQTKIREIDIQKLEIAHKYENLIKDHEHLKFDLDQVRADLSNDIIEKDRKYGELLLEKENLLTQIVGLKNEFETLNSNYNLKDNEIENLKAEFSNYKVRAQSVLRQNQSNEGSREKELEDDMLSMQTTIETITVRLKDVTNENISLKKTINELKVDTEMFQNRCNELLLRLDNTRIEYETSLDEIRKQNVKHQEIIKTQRSQIDSLNHCFKIQIAEMEDKYSNEIKVLREKINLTLPSNQTANIANIIDNNNDSLSDALRLPSNYNSITTDEQKIQMILQEKEMAEISNHDVLHQSSNRSSRHKYETIPLEQLLNNPIEETSISERVRSMSPTRELNVVKETVATQTSQIKHLSTLLAEAEQDLLRLTQLNELLKQEVRKQQLNLEREQHIQNSEYMKNVILKFVTLNSGDEKLHLVPVLNTILKLSPEETNKLQAVAKGEGSKWLERFPLWSNNS